MNFYFVFSSYYKMAEQINLANESEHAIQCNITNFGVEMYCVIQKKWFSEYLQI